MDVQTATDIIEIQALLAAYVFACDEKHFDALDAVFTPDARLTYLLDGGQQIVGSFPVVKDWIRRTLECFPMSEHLIGLPRILVDGDRARASSMLFNPMLLGAEDGNKLFFIGGTYEDKLLRTDHGWRITERSERGKWASDAPDWAPPEFVSDL